MVQAMASSVEGSGDTLHLENEADSAAGGMDPLGTAKGKAGSMDQLEATKVATPIPDSGAGCKACSSKEGGCHCSPSRESPAAAIPQPGDAEMGHSAPPESLISATGGFPEPSKGPSECPSKISITDMDCLICFNRYSACRLPKLLACQHAFCAVCLKLILQNKEQNWVITCPLCRKATLVFGGLICSLRDKEDILGRLDEPDAKVPCPPDPPGQIQADHQTNPPGQEHDGDETNRVAAKRLVLLLLLVAVLIVLVLPFLYTGLLKWALCFIMALGLLISGVLCCNPTWTCSDLQLPPWRRKETQVASVA